MAEKKYEAAFIDSLVQRSGKSRATIFRRLAAEWTEADILAGEKSAVIAQPKEVAPVVEAKPAVILEPPADDVKFAVTWAQAVLWAADNVDVTKKKMTKTRAGSALRYNLFLFAKDDLRELHANLIPKALSILDKNKNPEGGDLTAAEEKNCDELLTILKQALAESNRQWIERN